VGAPRFHFFAGKGGVGKTTCAAAAAVAAATAGARVLAVSTDPAHSLFDALALRPSAGRAPATATARRTDARARDSRPRRVALGRARGSLHAVELDADAALARWLGARRDALFRLVGRGTYLDDDDIDALLRLAFPGVDELIGLIELDRLAQRAPWNLVVVDTAPTGHTLRLLAMPATLTRIAAVFDDMQAKHRFLSQSLGGRYRPDAADALADEVAAAGRDLAALLRDPDRVRISWVLLPEALSLEEAGDGIEALEAGGIRVDEILVNRVTPGPGAPCVLCDRRRAAEAPLRAAVAERLGRRDGRARTLRMAAALDREPRSVSALRTLARRMTTLDATVRRPARRRPAPRSARTVTDDGWVGAVAPAGRQLVLFAGKGGVGKTTCAAAAALGLAENPPGRRVLVASTDPAHSLGDALDLALSDKACEVPGGPPSLHAREVDAQGLFAARRGRYLESVDAVFAALRGGSSFDPTYDRIVVEDLIDLAPPGLDELLGILSLTEAIGRDGHADDYDTIVIDTAPTGHALRLLAMPDAALAWVHAFMSILLKYRSVMGVGELGQELVGLARELRALRTLLTDPARATVIAVTRAAELPRVETTRLLSRLRALGVGVGAVIVNALTPPGCPRCRRAGAAERRILHALRSDATRLAARGCAIIQAPAVAPPPRGVAALTAWRRAWLTTT
jgi:arsenite-transporting ATPase